jgi:two-component system sensor histidine kinase KdpD
VHIETPAESAQKISTADFRALLDNVNLAADLGAEVAWLKSGDVIGALMDFAREKRITRIILGRTHQSFWNWLRRSSVTAQLLSAARDFDLEIVAAGAADEKS